MKRLVLATAALVLALASTLSTTAAENTTTVNDPIPLPIPAHCRVPSFAKWSHRVWRLDRWRRKEIKEGTRRAKHRRLSCASPDARQKMVTIWRRDKSRFKRARARRISNRQYEAAITPPGASVLAAIRACESGGDYSANTGNGFYGAYQFIPSTWESVGGSGLPSEASPREQDERAAALYRASGRSPWPVCGV